MIKLVLQSRRTWFVLGLGLLAVGLLWAWSLRRQRQQQGLPVDSFRRPVIERPVVRPPISQREIRIEGLISRYHADPSPERAQEIAALRGDALRVLLRLLQGLARDPRWRETATRLIVTIGETDAAPAMIEVLGRSHPVEYAKSLAEILGALRSRAAVPVLLRLFAGDEIALRRAAAAALGEIGDARAALPLAAGLSHEALRGTVLVALGKLKSIEPLPPILAIWRETGFGADNRLLYQAVVAMGPAVLLPLLQELARVLDPRPGLRGSNWALRLGRRFLGEETPDDPTWSKRLLEIYEQRPALRAAVLYMLQWRSEDRLLTDGLLARWSELVPGLRAEFVLALRTIAPAGDPRVVRWLLQVMQQPGMEAEAVRHAVVGLGRIGGPAQEPALRARLKGADEELRKLIEKAIEEIQRRN